MSFYQGSAGGAGGGGGNPATLDPVDAIADGDRGLVADASASDATRNFTFSQLLTYVAAGLSPQALENSGTGALNNISSTSGGANVPGIRFSGVAPDVSGIASGAEGRTLLLVATGGPLILRNENASSIAANRILTHTGADLTVPDEYGIALRYDGVASRWRVVRDASGDVPAVAIPVMNIDWSAGRIFTKTLAAGSNFFTFSNATSGRAIRVRLTSHASGSTVTWPTSSHPGGTSPTQSTPGKTDLYELFHDGTNIHIIRVGQDMAVVSGAPVPTATSASYSVVDSGGGDSLTITGTNLASATSVSFGGTSATITANTSTSITFTVPATTAGTKSVTVTTPGGTTSPLSIKALSVAGLPWNGRWRGSYSGSPWTATIGTNLTETTNPPAVGSATAAGFTPADFDGTNDVLTGGTSNTYVAITSGIVLALINADTFAANSANFYDVPGIISQGAVVYYGIGVSTSGLRGGVNDGAIKHPAAIPFASGGWHLVALWWDSTNVYQSVDGGTPTSTAAGALPVNSTQPFQVGANRSKALFFDGQILEVGASQTSAAFSTGSVLADLFEAMKCHYRI